jgi:hypothetical protein
MENADGDDNLTGLLETLLVKSWTEGHRAKLCDTIRALQKEVRHRRKREEQASDLIQELAARVKVEALGRQRAEAELLAERNLRLITEERCSALSEALGAGADPKGPPPPPPTSTTRTDDIPAGAESKHRQKGEDVSLAEELEEVEGMVCALLECNSRVPRHRPTSPGRPASPAGYPPSPSGSTPGPSQNYASGAVGRPSSAEALREMLQASEELEKMLEKVRESN